MDRALDSLQEQLVEICVCELQHCLPVFLQIRAWERCFPLLCHFRNSQLDEQVGRMAAVERREDLGSDSERARLYQEKSLDLVEHDCSFLARISLGVL